MDFSYMFWRRHFPAILLGLCACVWAITAPPLLFPYLSNNTDEAIYLLQAKTLLHGKLWIAQTPLSDFFFTWFQKLHGTHYSFKYTPVHAGILAAGKLLTGDFRSALGAVAFAVILLVYLLCLEMGMGRRAALLAAAFVLLSPLFLILSATYLSYCSFLMLGLIFALSFHHGLRKHSSALVCGAGCVLGVMFFARPYDALLFAVPWIVFLPCWQRPRLPETFRLLAPLPAGFLPVLAVVLVFNAATTGSAVQFPFAQDELDTFGFGMKRMFQEGDAMYYNFDAAITALKESSGELARWIFGGLLCIYFLGIFIAYEEKQKEDGALLGMLLIFPAGYFFFWGPYNMMKFGALYYLGPDYYLPCIVPLAIYSARGLLSIARGRTVFTAFAFLAMVMLTIPVFLQIVERNDTLALKAEKIYRPVTSMEASEHQDAIIFVPPVYGSFLIHPFRVLANDPVPGGRNIYAVDRYSDNFRLLDAYPERRAFRFEYYGVYRDNPEIVARTGLIPLQRNLQKAKNFSVTVTPPPYAQSARICLRNGQRERCLWDEKYSGAKAYHLKLLITARGVFVAASDPLSPSTAADRPVFPLDGASPLSVTARFGRPPLEDSLALGESDMYEYRYLIRPTAEGNLDSIEPPGLWLRHSSEKHWQASLSSVIMAQ